MLEERPCDDFGRKLSERVAANRRSDAGERERLSQVIAKLELTNSLEQFERAFAYAQLMPLPGVVDLYHPRYHEWRRRIRVARLQAGGFSVTYDTSEGDRYSNTYQRSVADVNAGLAAVAELIG